MRAFLFAIARVQLKSYFSDYSSFFSRLKVSHDRAAFGAEAPSEQHYVSPVFA